MQAKRTITDSAFAMAATDLVAFQSYQDDYHQILRSNAGPFNPNHAPTALDDPTQMDLC